MCVTVALFLCLYVCVCVYVEFIGTYKVENELMIRVKYLSPPLFMYVVVTIIVAAVVQCEIRKL